MTTLIGKKLLNYRIEKLLGQGGMGEVYLGVHTEIGRKVAIKVISPHLARDPRIQERFKREALILSRLNHPNIVQLYDYWAKEDEGLFLIMEYVEGIGLDRYIHRVLRGPVPPRQAIDIFLQILEAFQYAHDHGVIHRDIKPSNILLRNDGVVKILDFGIARIMASEGLGGGEDASLTRTGVTLGTVLYMSPEQLKSKHSSDIDHRSDIYSLGVVLFEMLSGQEMYNRTELSEFEILVKIASEPPPLGTLSPQLEADFGPILSKALAKKREERYASCREFAEALRPLRERYANEELARSRPINPVLAQTQTAILSTPSAPSKATSAAPKRGNVSKYLVGIGGLALLLGGLWWYWKLSQERQKTLELAEAFITAMDSHDEAYLRKILAPTLKPFFADSALSYERALQKYFLSFWKSIQHDSIGWVQRPLIHREKGRWVVEGLLYHAYTTRPQLVTQREPYTRYNKLYGRYETLYRTITREVPPVNSCKKKRLRIYIQAEKVEGVEVVEVRDC
ncbi:MAG: serine/threonine-protein kinase [Bacteroidia bacterium]